MVESNHDSIIIMNFIDVGFNLPIQIIILNEKPVEQTKKNEDIYTIFNYYYYPIHDNIIIIIADIDCYLSVFSFERNHIMPSICVVLWIEFLRSRSLHTHTHTLTVNDKDNGNDDDDDDSV